MTAQVLFFNDFSEKDLHLNAVEKSPQKGLFLFHKPWSMTNDCDSVPKTVMIGVKLMTESYKKIFT